MTWQNTGSISHRYAVRLSCSHAERMLPDPAVKSRTISPGRVQRRKAFSWSNGFFCVGCSYWLPGKRFTSQILKRSRISSVSRFPVVISLFCISFRFVILALSHGFPIVPYTQNSVTLLKATFDVGDWLSFTQMHRRLESIPSSR